MAGVILNLSEDEGRYLLRLLESHRAAGVDDDELHPIAEKLTRSLISRGGS